MGLGVYKPVTNDVVLVLGPARRPGRKCTLVSSSDKIADKVWVRFKSLSSRPSD